MFGYLTAAGLSVSAGLNAYIPLLVVGVLSRVTDAVSVPSGFGWLTSWWAMAIMAVLLCVELVVDKIAVVDHINDVVQTVIRPASGGVISAAVASASDVDHSVGTAVSDTANPVVGAILGVVLALAVHIVKVLVRPVINAGTFGFGTPVVSAAEDTTSAGMSLLAVLVPILAGIGLLLFAIVVFKLWRARRRWKRRRAERRAEDVRAR